MKLKLFSIILFLISAQITIQTDFLKDITLTLKEKLKLDEFRDLVIHELPHAYMREDIYLMRWLRARNFDIHAARRMLEENLQWRRVNNMDNILSEDWTEFENDYRIDVVGCDKQGRPIAVVFASDWDVRRVVVSGKNDKMFRYIDRFFEQMTTIIRHAQAEGKNVTQFDEIYELGNFNMVQHGCALCIPIYAYLFSTYENHYPGATHIANVINVPAIFTPFWNILKPLMSEQTQSLVHLYGRNKEEWKEALHKEMDPSQLTSDMQGTKEFPIDMFALRKRNYTDFQC